LSVALPDPLGVPVIVAQDESLLAVHWHALLGSVMATEPLAPAEPTEAVTGAIVAEQTTPACVIVKVWPPTEIVPVRLDRLWLAATLYATVPSPVPLPPDVIEIHVADAEAFHVHPFNVSTLTVPLVAPAGTDVLTGERLKVHVCPACVTVKVWPAIVMVPLRVDVPGLAATEYATCPFPLPFAPLVTVTHDVLLLAVHAQPLAAVTATFPVVAADPTFAPTGEMP
jgi:hypothetical protein